MEKINKTDNMKLYRDKYRQNNPDKWKKNNICVICGGKYQNSGKTMHLRTQKHKNKLKFDKLEKEIERLTK